MSVTLTPTGWRQFAAGAALLGEQRAARTTRRAAAGAALLRTAGRASCSCSGRARVAACIGFAWEAVCVCEEAAWLANG